MLRARRSGACLALLCASMVLEAPARAQSAPGGGRIYDIAAPDGLAQVLGASNDALTPARSHALVDFIRRTYDRPVTGPLNFDPALVARPDASIGTLPLPLPPDVWIDAVFAGRETPETLLGAILKSRGAALFYYGLLSLDDGTRAWLATEPQLIAELAGRRSAAFVVAAPGLRVRAAALDVPGGSSAAPLWESLAGHRTADPAGFVRALLARDEGRLAFFFGTMAQLTPGQLRVALRLDSPDPAVRLAAARRLRAVFERVVKGWRVDDSVFLRPAIDPALLAASLRHDGSGLPILPGTRGFWTAVFDRKSARSGAGRDTGGRALISQEPVDFAWLCEQVFTGSSEDRRRYLQVLFVSRLAARHAQWTAPEAIEVVRAVHVYPALVYSLERAKLADVPAFTAAVRRAEVLTAIRDDDVAARALAQFQGALALVTRAATRGGVRPDALATTISSLSGVELSDRGHYEGRLVRWLADWLEGHVRDAPAPEPGVAAAGPMERDALAALAGPADREPRLVEWEGTRYRLDFAAAEALRIARLLGAQSRPFLSSARALVEIAVAIDRGAMASGAARQHAEALERIGMAVGWDGGTDVPRRFRDATAAVRQAAATDARRLPASVAPALLELADDLLARGLIELAYAVALGQPERPAIAASEAARRHEFARHFPWRRSVAWAFPERGTVPQRGWYVSGSILGLDLHLADLGLLRLSLKPPGRKPSLADHHRAVLTETVALVEFSSLAADDHARIASAIRNGRARLEAARTPDDALALADEIRLSPTRRTLLSWAITKSSDEVSGLLAPSELLWLGLEHAPVPAGLHGWGAPAGPRTGCLCLEVLDRQPWETLAGRRLSGALSSGFSDLNLRLAELLDDLGMPAPLLAPVLAAATLDLVETAQPRDADDRQALLNFVHALHAERVEQYLALLTTGGPLVPIGSGELR